MAKKKRVKQKKEVAIAEANVLSAQIIDTVREAMLVLDQGLRVVAANQSFYDTFQVSPVETEGRLVYELGNNQWNIPELRKLLEDVLPVNNVFNDFEVHHEFETIGRKVMLLNARKIKHFERILLAIEDVTDRKRGEELQARLAAIVESSDDAIIGKTLDGTVTSWNRGAEMLYGYTAHEMIGQPIARLVPSDRSDEAREILERLQRGELVQQFHTVRVCKDGSKRQVSLTISPVRNARRTIIGASAIARDITEQVRAEQTIQQLNESLEQQVTERTSALAMLHDIATLVNETEDVETAILYALKRVSEHNGWSCGHAWLPAEEDPEILLPGYTWYEQAPPYFDRLREQILSTRVKAKEDFVGRVFTAGAPEFTNDIAAHLSVYKLPIANHLGIQTACAFPILAAEKTVGVLEFFAEKRIDPTDQMRDSMSSVGTLLGRVIEREQARRTLRTSEEQLRAILNAAPDAIVTIDRRGVITRVNPATEAILSYSSDELLGQNVSLLMPSPYRKEHDGYIGRYLETREPHIIGRSREVRAQHKDGRKFAIDVAVNEINDMELFIGVLRDISRRKELEKEVIDASADEQRRIGQDIHDGVGQELTGLRYMSQTHVESLVRQSSPDAKTAERMTEWLSTVQQQLRSIVRRLVPVEVDQEGLAAALRGLAQRTSEAQDLDCEFRCDQPITIPDPALATHLYRIAQEAVQNAVRHARPSSITIHLAEHEDTLKLQVVDDGVGIGATPDKHSGIGLRSIEYRAGLIGASINIRTGEEGGTQVTCTVLRGSELG